MCFPSAASEWPVNIMEIVAQSCLSPNTRTGDRLCIPEPQLRIWQRSSRGDQSDTALVGCHHWVSNGFLLSDSDCAFLFLSRVNGINLSVSQNIQRTICIKVTPAMHCALSGQRRGMHFPQTISFAAIARRRLAPMLFTLATLVWLVRHYCEVQAGRLR